MLEKQKQPVPPQDVELEAIILGSILIDSECISEVYEILTSEAFYMPANKEIYKAMSALYALMQPIDLLTVKNELKRMGKIEMVGLKYLMSITNSIGSTAHIVNHAKIIADLHIRRRIIEISNNSMKQGFNDTLDSLEIIASTEKEFSKILNGFAGEKEKTLFEHTKDVFDDLDSETPTKNVTTGLRELDKGLGGMQAGDFVILAGRPGMCKSTCAMNMARSVALHQNNDVGIISLEMTGKQLAMRNALSEFYYLGLEKEYGKPNISKIRNNNLYANEKEGLKLALSQSAHIYKMHVNDKASLSYLQIAYQAREWKKKHNIELLIIDYLQLIKLPKSKQDTKTTEIEELCYQLKGLAKELEIPIIALSQLSREVEKRSDKRPQLSDLRDSGGIEQSADAVIFLYRPEYYGFMVDDAGNSTQNLLVNIIAKVRNNAISDVNSFIDLEKNLLTDYNSNFTKIENQNLNNTIGLEPTPF